MTVEIIKLTEELMEPTRQLLARYINSTCEDESFLSKCEGAIINLQKDKNAQLYLAKYNHMYVGFVTVYWGFSTTTGKPILRVQDIYIEPEHRNNGIAYRLLEFCEELARDRGSNSLRLETDTDNIHARNLYEKFGFESFPRKITYMKFLD